ncbi:MAG TPA: hypothetical protein VGL28_05115 [Steroidobacteraceae bacterium]|jgi:hypothetical protein
MAQLSEWLKIMLTEVTRKQDDARAAEEEAQRRAAAAVAASPPGAAVPTQSPSPERAPVM